MFVPIIGTESELGNHGLDISALPWLVARRAKRGITFPGIVCVNDFFGLNGCRIYKDCHSGVEYAAPECRTPREALVYEMAGPILINRIAIQALAEAFPDNIWALKNNNPPITLNDTESKFSYGNHINIQMPLLGKDGESDFRHNVADYAVAAGALIATLPLVSGAGLLFRQPGIARLGGRGYSFRLSARSHYSSAVLGTSATSNAAKPLILARDEALGSPSKFWRLQVIGLDANILPEANLIKLTALQVTAEMWAAGLLEPVNLADPVQAMRALSDNWQARHDVLGGNSLTAVDIQYRYLRQAVSYVLAFNRTDYAPGLRAWARQLYAFRSCANVPQVLFGRNDWVTKYLLMRRRSANFDQAQMLSLGYHGYRLGRDFESSQPQRLLSRFGPPGLLSEIRQAVTAPPPTRAAARSRFIAAIQTTNSLCDINWTQLRIINPGKSRDIKLLNPRLASPNGLASFIQDMLDTHFAA